MRTPNWEDSSSARSKIVTLKLIFIPNLRKLEKFNTSYTQHVHYITRYLFMLTCWRNFAHRSAKRGGHRWTRRIIISVYSLKSYFFCLYLDLWRFEKLVGVNIFFPDCNVPSFKVQKWAFMVSTISKVKTLASFKNLSWFRPRTSHTGNRLLLKGVWMGVPHLDNTFWLRNMK